MSGRPSMHRGASMKEVIACGVCAVLLVLALGAAGGHNRDYAQAAICADRLHVVSGLMQTYLNEHNELFPPSYAYASDNKGNYDLYNQNEGNPFGYVHWSWMLTRSQSQPDDLFQCPAMKNGGAPRTNPGPRAADWEVGQVDDWGQQAPNERIDKQSPRMAYTANGAIVPHNKFTNTLSGGPRVNVLVSPKQVTAPSRTILLTEFLDNWKALGVSGGGGVIAKSHRPVTPFYHVGAGFDVWKGDLQSGFIYGVPQDQSLWGLLATRDIRDKTNILDKSSGISQINAVGRHHPGGDRYYDGTANFLFIDGSVRRTSPWTAVEDRLWGDRFYSITGENGVLNYE